MADINDKLALSKALFGSRVTGAGNLRRTTGTALSASSQGRVNVLFSDDDAGEGIEVDCLGTVKEGDTVTILVEGGKPTCLGPAGWGDAIEDQIGQIEAGAGTWVGTCSTDGAAAAKTASIEGFELREGATVLLTFEHANTASGVTLDVSGTGAKPVVNLGAQVGDGIWRDGESVLLTYDGESWQVIGDSVYAQQVTVGIPAAEHVTVTGSGVQIADGSEVLAIFSGDTIQLGRDLTGTDEEVQIKLGDVATIGIDLVPDPNPPAGFEPASFPQTSLDGGVNLDISTLVGNVAGAYQMADETADIVMTAKHSYTEHLASITMTSGSMNQRVSQIAMEADSLTWNGRPVAYGEDSATEVYAGQLESANQPIRLWVDGPLGLHGLIATPKSLFLYDGGLSSVLWSINPAAVNSLALARGTGTTALPAGTMTLIPMSATGLVQVNGSGNYSVSNSGIMVTEAGYYKVSGGLCLTAFSSGTSPEASVYIRTSAGTWNSGHTQRIGWRGWSSNPQCGPVVCQLAAGTKVFLVGRALGMDNVNDNDNVETFLLVERVS